MASITAPPDDDDSGWEFPKPAPIRFADFATELLTLYEPPLRSIRTRDKMRFVIRIIAELLGPEGSTADINPRLVARFIAGRPASEVSVTTHFLLGYFRAACNYAKSQGYLVMSPFDYRKKWIKVTYEPKKRHHSMEDIRSVLDLLAREAASGSAWPQWRSRRLLAVASLFAYTGLRKEEGLRLQVEDVDLERRMIFLMERKGRRLKTEASAQPVPIPDALLPILEDWLSHRMDAEDGRTPPDCPWLFPGVTRKNPWTSGPMGHRPLDSLKAAGERAGVHGLNFQSLRHSFATHAESWGLSPAMLQRVLRHTSLGTQSHYRHADLDNMRSAVDGISFGPPTPPPAPDTEGGPTS
jgi:integrase